MRELRALLNRPRRRALRRGRADRGREAVAALRSRGLALRFVTNTTTHPRRRVLERLNHLGFEVDAEELATPAALAVACCRERRHRRVALLMNEAVKADFQELEEGDEDVDAVLVGDLGEAFSYPVLNRAFRHLIGGADLSALQKNRYWPLHVVADDRRVGAQAAGLAGILVRTGKFRTAALEASGVTPTAIVDSIADVPGLLGTSR